MFCYQCEQTVNGSCTQFGNCGKDPTTAALQDVLLYAATIISRYAHRLRALGVTDRTADVAVVQALFTTVTNVNFDPERLHGLIQEAIDVARGMKMRYIETCAAQGFTPDELPCAGLCDLRGSVDDIVAAADQFSIGTRLTALGPDVTGLQELLTYGLKGVAAYAAHAMALGQEDDAVFAGLHEGLNVLACGPRDEASLTACCLLAGELNLKAVSYTHLPARPAAARNRLTRGTVLADVRYRAFIVSAWPPRRKLIHGRPELHGPVRHGRRGAGRH